MTHEVNADFEVHDGHSNVTVPGLSVAAVATRATSSCSSSASNFHSADLSLAGSADDAYSVSSIGPCSFVTCRSTTTTAASYTSEQTDVQILDPAVGLRAEAEISVLTAGGDVTEAEEVAVRDDIIIPVCVSTDDAIAPDITRAATDSVPDDSSLCVECPPHPASHTAVAGLTSLPRDPYSSSSLHSDPPPYVAPENVTFTIENAERLGRLQQTVALQRSSSMNVETATQLKCINWNKKYLPIFVVIALANSALVCGFGGYDMTTILQLETKQQTLTTGNATSSMSHEEIHVENSDKQKLMIYVLLGLQVLLLIFVVLGLVGHLFQRRNLLLPWLVTCFPISGYAMVYAVSFTKNDKQNFVYLKVLLLVIVFTLTAILFRIVYHLYKQPNRLQPSENEERTSLYSHIFSIFNGRISFKPPPYEKDPPPYETTISAVNVPSSATIFPAEAFAPLVSSSTPLCSLQLQTGHLESLSTCHTNLVNTSNSTSSAHPPGSRDTLSTTHTGPPPPYDAQV